MSKAEALFRKWLTIAYPDAYVKKFPDFKQTGSPVLKGMPDYLVMRECRCKWFEVKYITSKNTFNFNNINKYQWVEFYHMTRVGIDVEIAIYNGDYKLFLIKFHELLALRDSGAKSVKLD